MSRANRLKHSFVMLGLVTICISSTEFLFADADIVAKEKICHFYKDASKEALTFDLGNVRGRFQLKYKPESFYGRNINLFNNFNADQVIYSRGTVDGNLSMLYGKEYWGKDISEFFIGLRHKVVWGNPGTSAYTSEDPVKVGDALVGLHKHTIGKQFPFIREIWFKCRINEVFGINPRYESSFTLGSFAFELGRGISLGAAYSVNPGVLGFYSDNSIDQYAYGMKFTGGILSCLTYDLYATVLENFSDSLRVNLEPVRAMEIGATDPARGFGNVDFLLAGRLRWQAFKDKNSSCMVEPYILYSRAAEQRIEYPADSSADLGTIGLSAEYQFGNFEGGFDTGFNFGYQNVRAWDRNRPIIQRDPATYTTGTAPNAALTQVNSRVLTGPFGAAGTTNAPDTDANRAIIKASPQDPSLNGQQIGTSGLYNDPNRFRPAYSNKLTGKMAIIDAAYSVLCGDLKFAAMVGVATGDEDPNKNLFDPNDSHVDGTYNGFIPIQEIYSGGRVQSAFVLGGAGRLPRPLSTPVPDINADTLPTIISGFTNLVVVGTSAQWIPKQSDRSFMVKPNLLLFWQQHRTKAFDITTGMSSPTKYARNFLGTELNLFSDVEIYKDFKFYAVGSVFIPGAHYRDIRGKPLSAQQQKILSRLDPEGIDESVPLLGTNIAFTINLGLDFRY